MVHDRNHKTSQDFQHVNQKFFPDSFLVKKIYGLQLIPRVFLFLLKHEDYLQYFLLLYSGIRMELITAQYTFKFIFLGQLYFRFQLL